METTKNYIDFTLRDRGYAKTIFRFYKKQTHVHGFDENSPKRWEDVYKVYYSWAIIWHYNQDEDKKIERKLEDIELLDMRCDECSRVPDLVAIIKHVMETGETFNCPTFGQSAGDWYIEKETGKTCSDEEPYEDEPYEYYRFKVFNNLYGNGVRFVLDRKEAEAFCEYLDEINTYALAHSQGI